MIRLLGRTGGVHHPAGLSDHVSDMKYSVRRKSGVFGHCAVCDVKSLLMPIIINQFEPHIYRNTLVNHWGSNVSVCVMNYRSAKIHGDVVDDIMWTDEAFQLRLLEV